MGEFLGAIRRVGGRDNNAGGLTGEHQDAVKQTQHPDAQIYVLPGSDGALPASLPRGVKSYTEN
jgi:hypothetical protein